MTTDRAMQDAPAAKPERLTHYVRYDAPMTRGNAMAFRGCNVNVKREAVMHGDRPTCEICARLLDEFEAMTF